MSAERDRGSSPLLPAGHIRPAMEAMCSLLRAGRAPSELMARYAAADSRRGRNDPCPCGSSRKWKHCHQPARVSSVTAT